MLPKLFGLSVVVAAFVAIALKFGSFSTVSADSAEGPGSAPAAESEVQTLLLFTKTAGFRHGNIPVGVEALQEIGTQLGLSVMHTEDSAVFTDDGLADVAVVVFFSTTGNILDDAQQAAFERYIQSGGGFVGIHAATDTEYGWPWYNGLVGGYFAGHPKVQPAEMDVLIRDHPSTKHLPERWHRTDEWYNFKSLVDGLEILINLDETTYEGGNMGENHPIAWFREYDGGRSWYTGGGHTKASFSEPDFLKHIAGGIAWAAGLAE